jgi:hypothetical protein
MVHGRCLHRHDRSTVRRVAAWSGQRPLHTRRANGKVKRFHHTMATEWANVHSVSMSCPAVTFSQSTRTTPENFFDFGGLRTTIRVTVRHRPARHCVGHRIRAARWVRVSRRGAGDEVLLFDVARLLQVPGRRIEAVVVRRIARRGRGRDRALHRRHGHRGSCGETIGRCRRRRGREGGSGDRKDRRRNVRAAPELELPHMKPPVVGRAISPPRSDKSLPGRNYKTGRVRAS